MADDRHHESEEDVAEEHLEDPNWTKKKKRIVRQLLEEFDLDKVRQKYRCTNPIEFRVHPSEYSVGCALTVNLIRQRLIHLMGTDHVCINDREYIHKLIERVEEEYDKEEEKKERALQESERKRLRKLVSEGVITPDDVHQLDKEKSHPQRDIRTPPPHSAYEGKLVTEKPKPYIYFDENNKKIEDEKEKEEEENEDENQENGDEDEEEKGDEQEQETRKKSDPADDTDPLILHLREGNSVDELYERAEQVLRGGTSAQ